MQGGPPQNSNTSRQPTFRGDLADVNLAMATQSSNISGEGLNLALPHFDFVQTNDISSSETLVLDFPK